jgi:multidrug transporter EmrE-like cation transporter
MKPKNTWKQIVILQSVILIYTLSTVAAKFASGFELFSVGFIISYVVEIAILGLYAILWQQMMKRFDLSIAYANKAFGIFWSLLWAVIFFKERITIKNVIGVCVVFIGIMVINTDDYQ